jgi:hypothetical protein
MYNDYKQPLRSGTSGTVFTNSLRDRGTQVQFLQTASAIGKLRYSRYKQRATQVKVLQKASEFGEFRYNFYKQPLRSGLRVQFLQTASARSGNSGTIVTNSLRDQVQFLQTASEIGEFRYKFRRFGI